ncbi:hypothetical protein BKI52_07405 [marine bacterium AO1-C]|nr:hypothetical protein BKI52_07405 [marine bacterium AO1-C]
MKIKTFVVALLLLGYTLSSKAQDNYQSSEYDVIYQIQVALINGNSVNWTKLKNLTDLGQLTTNTVELDPADTPGKTPVYLGYYLGKSTAQKVLAEVKKRGYTKAKMVSDGAYQLGHSTGKHIRYGLQLGAFKSLRLVKVGQYPKKNDEDRIYLQYKGGAYKVFYNLYTKGDTPPGLAEAKNELVPWLKKKGYQVFVQKFR